MTIFIVTFLAAITNVAFLVAVNALVLRNAPGTPGLLRPASVLAACGVAQAEAALAGGVPDLKAAVAILMVGCVAVSVLSDVSSGYVFDAITLSTLAATLVLSGARGEIRAAIEGAAAGGITIGALHIVSSGRGIGLGDAKLAACIGCALGPSNAVESVGAAFVIGGVVAAFILLTRRGCRKTSVPFAPFLAAGAAIILATVKS